MEGGIIEVIKAWTEGEITTFIKVWLAVYISLSYCYVTGKIVPKGIPRLFAIFPVVCLFLKLPLNLHSMHLGGMTSFFVAWLANFKLLMFAFNIGPLSDPSLSLPLFLAIACLPIKIQQNPPSNTQNQQNPSPKISLFSYAVKGLLLALFIRVYDYSEYIHPKLILFIYCFHIYFCLELILAMAAAMARALLGLELEPQFNEPLLSTSLQDFWGRRWNIMVNRILRPAVYDPILYMSARVMGRKWAPFPAVLGTFMVSAIMHEMAFYQMCRLRPTWRVTWFFLLHGVCLVVEIAIKKAVAGRWRLPPAISGPLACGLVVGTGFWLFFPQMLRCGADVRAIKEYAIVGAFLKDVWHGLTFSLCSVTGMTCTVK
ncbi:hypothetical protein RJ640_005733 [Escallonia rubra]|uniref:Wax synthase domain-containing protein n=1 Tax=Escallonia rubra TaxID=112253 RepID=A0AA88S5B8_9ASTE|nr:hypothetical protein RJ640_005733 [Escallonia rubra]